MTQQNPFWQGILIGVGMSLIGNFLVSSLFKLMSLEEGNFFIYYFIIYNLIFLFSVFFFGYIFSKIYKIFSEGEEKR